MQHLQNPDFELPLPIMNLDKEKIVSFLKSQRKLKNLNQNEVASKAGFLQQKLSQLENLTIDFTFDELNSWCKALEISPMQTLLYTHPMQPLTDDLKKVEEEKQKELKKNQLLEKIKEIMDNVKKM